MSTLKTLAIAAATVAATASMASANSYFPTGESYEAGDVFELGTVRSEGAGVIAIYDFHKGVRGELLGTEDVREGVNTNVKIGLGIHGNLDVLAVLTVDGQEVVSKAYDVR